MSGDRKFRRMTPLEVVKAHEKMREVLVKDEATGLFSYIEGWSDRRVAHEIDDGSGEKSLSENAISDIRMKLFGAIRAPRPRKSRDVEHAIADLNARLDQLARAVVALEARQGGLL